MNIEAAVIISFLVGALTTLLIGTAIDRKQFKDLTALMRTYIEVADRRREEWQQFTEVAEAVYWAEAGEENNKK